VPRRNPHDRPVAAAPRDARSAAWHVLGRFQRGECERVGDDLDRLVLDARDAGLARELVLGVVRHQRLYDALSARFLRSGRQPDELLLALRLAAHQLFALDGVPPHAACDTTVELVRQHRLPHLIGVANAVVRRLAELRLEDRQGEGPLGRLRPEAWPKALGERHSLPDALVADLRPLIAGDEDRRLAALNAVPHLCTRTRPGIAPPQGHAILRQEGEWTWWSDASAALAGPVADGRCVVQDRAQGHVVDLSRARPGERVLDVCASPGGKALAFAERGCRVVAADLSVDKTARLRQTLGAAGAILVQDGRRPALAPGFDIVVVDAPCSNTGVLGRRPEARWRYDRAALTALGGIQRGLLAAASRLVVPGGRLVYSTCSVSPAENQGIAHRLDGWRILAEHASWPDGWQGGGYVAVLVRI
jgi:16S rRNA (cytosine967-C5)-methyltransferase